MSGEPSTQIDDDALQSRPLSAKLIFRIFRSLGRYLWAVLLGSILLLGCVWADLRIIHEMSELVDRPDLRVAPLWSLVRPFLFLALANRIFGIAQYMVTVFATNRAMADLRTAFFDKLMTLPKSFFDKHKSGWLVARSTGDMGVLSEFMTFTLMMLVYLGVSMGYALTRIYSIAPILLAPCAVTIPLAVILTLWFKRNMSRVEREARRQSSRLTANLAENIRGVRVVQAFSREERNLETFNQLNKDSHDTELKAAYIGGLFMPSMDFLGILNIAVVVALSAWLFHHPDTLLQGNTLTPGDLVAYILYVNVILWPVRMVVQLYSMSLRAMAAGERIYEIIDLVPEISDPREDRTPAEPDGEITFTHVNFAYTADGPPVLKDFSLTVRAGSTVALVGTTGAGKTTAASLVARFYDVGSGSICIDGVDVREYSQESLHGLMGTVPQEGYLFTGTVLDNLRFARPEMTEAHVVTCARELGTHDIILSLPRGYQTLLGEGGTSISEGQRQLISITRALVADPRILLLDEPTAALDTYTEQLLQASLERLVEKRTTIIIAHRLSTIRNADNIVVIENGHIAEQGTHQTLMTLNQRYADLINAHGSSPVVLQPDAEDKAEDDARSSS